jgi:hypothetical protein
VSAEPGPPPIQPPQLSPDGRYVWDGSQWQPIADPAEPVHKAVFAAWNAIKVEPADPAAAAQPVQFQQQVQAPMLVREQAPPAIDYAYEVEDPVTPLWQQPTRSGKTTYLYAGAGLVVFVIAIMLLNSFNFFQFAWLNSSSSSPVVSPQPSPVVDQTRSEFGRADRFLNGSLGPALAGLVDTMQQMQTCNGTLSNSCYDAINATDPELKKVLSVLDRATNVPTCIAAPMKSFRADIVVMQAGIQLALKGYKDNQRGEVGNGLSQYARGGQAMVADGRTADQALKTQCTKDLEGP